MTEIQTKLDIIEPKLCIDTPYILNKKYQVETKIIRHDNIDFYTTRFPATGKRKGKIMILHGWCEHCLMYYRIMEFLSTVGYESFIYDQRGSGRTSLGKYRGRCGRKPNTVYNDLSKMIEIFKLDENSKNNNHDDNADDDANEGETFYLMGHSAGGGIALNYMIDGKYKNLFTGVLTTGPLIKITENLSPSPMIEYVLNFIASWFPYTPYGSINTDPNVKSTITTAEEWVNYLQNELLTQGNTTLGQIKDMFDRGYKLANIPESEIEVKYDLKLLTIHCVNDTMTSFKQLKLFFDKLPIKYKKFVQFDEGNHSLFIETDEIFNKTCKEIAQFLE